MPIYLPPISRRRFLSRALAAAGGLTVGADIFAAPREPDARSWALLSDLHLAADTNLVSRGVNMTGHFKQVAAELLKLPEMPSVMITGDCAYNSGELADYALVGDLLKPVRKGGMPVHLALGNHDHREHFWEAFKEEKAASRPVEDRQTALLQAPNVNWFILDSLETTLSSPGLLGDKQLHWLAKALDEHPKT